MRPAQTIAPLLRASEVRALRDLIKAAPAGFPYPGLRTLAGPQSRAKAGAETVSQGHASRVLAVEPVSRPAAGWSAAATSEPMDATAGETAPIIELPATGIPAGDRAGACAIERAPEGTSGSVAGGHERPANVRSQRTVAEPAKIDLKAAPSAMDARFVRSVPTPLNAPPRLALPPGQTEARADPCARCEGRWPIVRLHPIISACIETPCPMKAMLPKAKHR